MSLARDVQRGFLLNELGSILTTVGGLAFTILIVRKLGPADYGRYALTMTMAGTMVAATALGLSGVVGHFVSRCYQSGENNQAALLFRQLLAVRSMALAIVAVAIFKERTALSRWYGNPTVAVMADLIVVLGFAQGVSDLFFQLLAARLRFGEMRLVQTIVQWMALASALLLERAGLLAVRPLVTIQVALAMVQLLVLLRSARTVFGAGGRLVHPVRPIVQFAWLYWLQSFLTHFLAMGMDVLVIGHYDPHGTWIGYYNVSMATVSKMAALLLGGFSGMGLPALSRAYAGENRSRLAHAWSIFVELQALLIVPALGYAFVFAPEILTVLFSHRYDAAVSGFRLALAFNILIYGLGCGIHGIALQSMGHPGLPTLVRAVTGPVNLILDVALVPRMGYRGAIVGTGIATVATVLWEWGFFRHKSRSRLPLGFLARLAILTVVCIAAVLPLAGRGLAFAIAGAFVYGVLLAGGLLILRPFTSDDHALFGRQSSRVVSLVRLLARPAHVTRGPCPACGEENRRIILATDMLRIETCRRCGLGERRDVGAQEGLRDADTGKADSEAQDEGAEVRREGDQVETKAVGANAPAGVGATAEAEAVALTEPVAVAALVAGEGDVPGADTSTSTGTSTSTSVQSGSGAGAGASVPWDSGPAARERRALPAALELCVATDLRDAVAALGSRMPPGSDFPLESPCPGGWPAVLMGTRWPGLTDDRFRWYLTDEALVALGARCGLEARRVPGDGLVAYPYRPGFRRAVRDWIFGLAAALGHGDLRRYRLARPTGSAPIAQSHPGAPGSPSDPGGQPGPGNHADPEQ